MAKKTGLYAKVTMQPSDKSKEVDVMELRDWSVSVSSEKVDSNVAGEPWSDHIIGRLSWEGDATCISADQYWIEHLSDKLTINFYDDLNDSAPVYTGKASLDIERSVTHDDVIESSLTFTGAGELKTGDSSSSGSGGGK